MPPLPDQLTPNGKKTVAVAEVTPVIPRKDPGEVTPPVYIPKPKNVPVVADSPLVAVSPFLEWIKDHPTEATEQARKAAAAYNPAPSTAAASAPATAPPAPSSSSTTTTGSSAAIYSTPQKN
jgi:hypothetical protein